MTGTHWYTTVKLQKKGHSILSITSLLPKLMKASKWLDVSVMGLILGEGSFMGYSTLEAAEIIRSLNSSVGRN